VTDVGLCARRVDLLLIAIETDGCESRFGHGGDQREPDITKSDYTYHSAALLELLR
jgi:hypothetical protein